MTHEWQKFLFEPLLCGDANAATIRSPLVLRGLPLLVMRAIACLLSFLDSTRCTRATEPEPLCLELRERWNRVLTFIASFLAGRSVTRPECRTVPRPSSQLVVASTPCVMPWLIWPWWMV